MLAFGAWLVRQGRRPDWIGELAKCACRDPRFPRDAGPDEVRRYLGGQGGLSGDVAECLEDAEVVWERESLLGASSVFRSAGAPVGSVPALLRVRCR